MWDVGHKDIGRQKDYIDPHHSVSMDDELTIDEEIAQRRKCHDIKAEVMEKAYDYGRGSWEDFKREQKVLDKLIEKYVDCRNETVFQIRHQ